MRVMKWFSMHQSFPRPWRTSQTLLHRSSTAAMEVFVAVAGITWAMDGMEVTECVPEAFNAIQLLMEPGAVLQAAAALQAAPTVDLVAPTVDLVAPVVDLVAPAVQPVVGLLMAVAAME